MRTVVIAEPGSTHEGSLETMRSLIYLAADVGCDVFKSQWVSSAKRLSQRRRAPQYLASYTKLEYPLEWHRELRIMAAAKGMRYGCSVYLPEDVERIAPYTDFIKCASFEAEDAEMVKALRPYAERVIISLGMGAKAPHGWPGIRLHCVSAYPAPNHDMNLARLRSGDYDGLSDHSHSPLTGPVAVAAGARYIEFHLRLDDCREDNADYVVSRDPDAARQYVRNIRSAEELLGNGRVGMADSEKSMWRFKPVTR